MGEAAAVKRNGTMKRKIVAAPALAWVCIFGNLLIGSLRAELPANLDFSGVGWVQYGQVAKSTDTIPSNYNGDPMQNSGAQISVSAKLNDHLVGAVGLGVYEGHALAGQLTAGGRVTVSASPYISEARFTYTLGEKEKPMLEMTGGLFHYNYDANIKDLGLYLLRGSVYPGFLMSGFETKEVVPIANVLGLWLHNTSGTLSNDFIVNSETEVKPYFDLSVAYIGKAKVAQCLTLGAGVNFYRLIANDGEVSHHPFKAAFEKNDAQGLHPYDREFIYADTVAQAHDGLAAVVDTTFFGFDGTKLMADFEFDPKPFLGGGAFGPDDLKFYGEAAVMGLNFDKGHKAIYGKLANRLPIVLGFNFPMFGLLDHLSAEVEWYGAKFRDDLWRLEPANGNDRPISPIPFDLDGTMKSYTRDNLKWAVHAAKTIQGHFKVSGQIANDHFRPFGTAGTDPTYEVATSTLKDWYWMTKIAYFF